MEIPPPVGRALPTPFARGAHAAVPRWAIWRRRRGSESAPAGRRVALTVVDQGVSSISNFVVSVAIARLDGAATLGAFALACAIWQVAAALHRALVTDPMTVFGNAYGGDAASEVRRGLAAELLLGAGGATVLALVGGSLLLFHQHMYGSVMLLLAPWVPLLIVQDYWRWIGFMTRRPGRALANDAIFNVVQGGAFAALLVFHVYSIGLIVAAWGVGGLAGAAYGLVQYRVRPTSSGGFSLLVERWHLSKWLAADTLVANFAAQAYIVVAGIFLGPVGLGQLQAARTLVIGPSMMLIQAGGSAGLPEASRAFGSDGWRGLRRVSAVVTALAALATGSCAAIMALAGRQILSRIYGPSFAHLQLVALLIGVGLVITSTELGPLLSLKATRNTRFILYMQLVNLVVTLGAVSALCAAFGLTGAACASVARCGAGAIAARWLLRRARAASPPDAPDAPDRAPDSPDPNACLVLLAPEQGQREPVAVAPMAQ